uniref:RING-type domain-containing protein n=1 Tax=Meloidogyne javanica TaxID=6303 RepID=A0A915LC12_MELJA
MSGVGCCCGHLYHSECIIKWIREAKNCPKCVRTSSVENIACLSNEPGRVARSSEDQRLSNEPDRVARLSDQQLEGEQLSVEYDKVTRLSDQQLEEQQLSIELDRVTSLSDRQFEETEIQDFEFNQIIEKITNAAANNLRINEQFEDLKGILENQHGEKNLLLSVANPQFTPSQINCPERVTVRRKFIPKVQNLERVPIAKKRPAMKVVNGASPAMSVFGKNKQVPVNLLAASKPWRPHGTKQHQLHKPSHQNNKTPNNIGITKSAKRKLRLDSPIGSPMFTSTPNEGRKFPAFVIG